MGFDPIRHEELRIMGYSDAFRIQGSDVEAAMAKQLAPGQRHIDSGAGEGDWQLEYEDGTVTYVLLPEFEEHWTLLPAETVDQSEPVELAQPAGLLVATEQDPSDEGASADD